MTKLISRSTCPPWCAVDDHATWDGQHRAELGVALSSFPLEPANICLQAADGHAPVIVVEIPPDENGQSPELTLAEAGDVAAAILRLAGYAWPALAAIAS